ncbi:hypothetical protein CDAR_188491 [Caerostris darwini]|uniref:Uncharacterized protein n=1 Tax=Caerostris darwini TaxID=1538125 RepID=A0AAV4V7T3_9ARAC|nr:hypothetical protein CDAR_188361 [Caerostris darwini]GIY65772.1 hypothetical protein CDAR_188491 [Caerostris darwini]
MKSSAAENGDFSFNSFLKTCWLQTNEWEGDARDFQLLWSTGEFCGCPGAVVCFRPGGVVLSVLPDNCLLMTRESSTNPVNAGGAPVLKGSRGTG